MVALARRRLVRVASVEPCAFGVRFSTLNAGTGAIFLNHVPHICVTAGTQLRPAKMLQTKKRRTVLRYSVLLESTIPFTKR